jgi:hypothetical protein
MPFLSLLAKTVNQTDEFGEPMEAPFEFNLGFFGMCRAPAKNMSNFRIVDPERVYLEYPRHCVANPMFSDEDLSDYSFAANIILCESSNISLKDSIISARLVIPACLQIFGIFLCIVGLFLSMAGEFKRNHRTISSAMFYIMGGLLIFVAVLQVICAVDDEMTPRMKPKATGEQSSFNFRYGLSFFATALSFLPIQVCVYLQAKSYFDRYPLPLDKANIVPGLGEMSKCLEYSNNPRLVDEMLARLRKGLPIMPPSAPLSASSHRRDSRCSRDYSVAFGGVQQEVQKLVPPLTESLPSRPSVHICI